MMATMTECFKMGEKDVSVVVPSSTVVSLAEPHRRGVGGALVMQDVMPGRNSGVCLCHCYSPMGMRSRVWDKPSLGKC